MTTKAKNQMSDPGVKSAGIVMHFCARCGIEMNPAFDASSKDLMSVSEAWELIKNSKVPMDDAIQKVQSNAFNAGRRQGMTEAVEMLKKDIEHCVIHDASPIMEGEIAAIETARDNIKCTHQNSNRRLT